MFTSRSCPKCRGEVAEAALFCSRCGAEQPVTWADGNVFGVPSPAAAPPAVAGMAEAFTETAARPVGPIPTPRSRRPQRLLVGLAALVGLAGIGVVATQVSGSSKAAPPPTTAVLAAPSSEGAAKSAAATASGQPISNATGRAVALRADGTLMSVDLSSGSQAEYGVSVPGVRRWQSVQSTGRDVFVMSQGQVQVVHARGDSDHAHDVGQGDRIVSSPGGHWVVAEEYEPSQSTPMARRLSARVDPIPVPLAPGMVVAGIAGDELVVAGGGAIYLLDPTSGVSRKVADGFVVSTADDLLVRSVCTAPTSCELRWGPWGEPDRNSRPLPEGFRGLWSFPGKAVLSPDRSRLAAVDPGWDDQQILVLELATGQVSSFASGQWTGPFPTVSFSADGNHVVHLRRDGDSTYVDITPLDGSPPSEVDMGDVVSVTAGNIPPPVGSSVQG